MNTNEGYFPKQSKRVKLKSSTPADGDTWTEHIVVLPEHLRVDKSKKKVIKSSRKKKTKRRYRSYCKSKLTKRSNMSLECVRPIRSNLAYILWTLSLFYLIFDPSWILSSYINIVMGIKYRYNSASSQLSELRRLSYLTSGLTKVAIVSSIFNT